MVLDLETLSLDELELLTLDQLEEMILGDLTPDSDSPDVDEPTRNFGRVTINLQRIPTSANIPSVDSDDDQYTPRVNVDIMRIRWR